MIKGVADGKNLTNNWRRIKNLQTSAKVLCFLQNNSISDVEQLSDKVTQMHKEIYDLSNGIKTAERRFGIPTEHLHITKTISNTRRFIRNTNSLTRKNVMPFMTNKRMKFSFIKPPPRNTLSAMSIISSMMNYGALKPCGVGQKILCVRKNEGHNLHGGKKKNCDSK